MDGAAAGVGGLCEFWLCSGLLGRRVTGTLNHATLRNPNGAIVQSTTTTTFSTLLYFTA